MPVCPAMVRRAWLLVRRVFCPACWCSSHSVRRLGGLPCLSAYSCASRFSSPVTATARELNRSITSWLTPPISAPLPSALGTMAYPSADSLVSRTPVGDRGDGEPLVVQGAGVQGPPLVVGAVGALDPVPDRDVHVQLRVAVAGQVMQEQAGDQAVAVAPLPRAGGMVPGPGVGGLPLEPATASRAESISASSISSARASSAAAWSSSPRSRALRAETR